MIEPVRGGYCRAMSRHSLSLEPTTAELAPLRSSLRGFLAESDEPADEWLLIATELVTNAIEAAPDASVIHIDLEVGDEWVELQVVDMGAGFELDPASSVPAANHRGRGLMMVNALSDDFSVSIEDGLTVATVRRRRATP